MIDWEKQWGLHAPSFKNGRAHIMLPSKNKMELIPGPGFGDFSHPTTRLVVELMPKYVSNQTVLDIGCGSGILSVAAAKMGASTVYACDIDSEALEHAAKNAQLNHVKILTSLPSAFSQKPIVLMNMISSEQATAWKKYLCPFDTMITSGILASDQDNYLRFANAYGWQLIKKRECDGWMGYIFKETYSS